MDTPTPKHSDVAFEHSDINVRHTFLVGIGVLVGLWISTALLFFVFTGLKHHREHVSGPPLPIEAHGNVLPPEPRLQQSPRLDMKSFRGRENWELTHYHWLDKSHGIVAIPIEQAIQMTAQRGIPRATGAPNTTNTPPVNGTSNTGFAGKVEPEPR